MRITRSAFTLTCVLLVAGDLAVMGQPRKYGVTVQTAKTAALAKAKTYSWTISQPSPDKVIDAQIVAAVDRELGALGFTKVASGKSDVQATYASQRRTDVELKSKTPNAKDGAREFPVGTLLVELRDPATRQALFRVRIDKPLDAEPEKLEGAINEAVTTMFEKYPTRTAAKR
jgi:hypothetical protein